MALRASALPIDTASGELAATGALLAAQLHRRAGDAAIGAEDAAVPRLGAQQRADAHAQWRQVADGLRERFPKVGALMDEAAIVRLVGALVDQQSDEWQVTRRYMSLETVARSMPRSSAVSTI